MAPYRKIAYHEIISLNANKGNTDNNEIVDGLAAGFSGSASKYEIEED